MIELTDDKDAIKIGRRAFRDVYPLSYKDLELFEIKALKDKEIIGAVFYKGPEVHVSILPKYRRRWMSKRIIREILKTPFDRFGYAVTMGFEKDRDFLERIGFKPQSKINEVTYYRIMPWEYLPQL